MSLFSNLIAVSVEAANIRNVLLFYIYIYLKICRKVFYAIED